MVGPSAARSTRRRPGWLLPVLAVVVVLAVAGALYAVLGGGGNGTLKAGSATAQVTWTPSNGCVTSFQGTAQGLALQGTAHSPFPSDTSAGRAGCTGKRISNPADLQHVTLVERYTGTLGGTPFDVSLAYSLGAAVPPAGSITAPPVFKVSGTFGNQPVTGTVSFTSQAGALAAFQGTVGNLRVSGVVHQAGTGQSGTASFTVTR